MHRGLTLAREWIQAQDNQQINHKRIPSAPQVLHADRREIASTCFADASWDSSTKRAGLAWIISETPESPPREGSLAIDGVLSPLVAEAIVIRSGILAAADLNITSLEVFSVVKRSSEQSKTNTKLKKSSVSSLISGRSLLVLSLSLFPLFLDLKTVKLTLWLNGLFRILPLILSFELWVWAS
ncbi:hypothetical protein Bca4012_065612 [Brassica carinata]